MQVEDLASDLPLAFGLEQGEHIRKAVPAPVLALEASGSDGLIDIDVRDLVSQLG